MVSIPKIKISAGRKREKHSLPCDCSTTANFGTVQPTFCREMLPNSSFKMSVASRVLLTGMPVPTFGRISMEHRHLFIPYVDVCPQFNSLLSNQPYSPTTGVSYYPEHLPPLLLQKISQYILGRWADISIYKLTGDASIQPIPIEIPADRNLTVLKQAWDDVIYYAQPIAANEDFRFYNTPITPAFRIASMHLSPLCGTSPRGTTGDRQGRLCLNGYYVSLDNSASSADTRFKINENANGGAIYGDDDTELITAENADYISEFGGSNSRYLIYFRLTPVGKRIRQVLIGLGYQFTPNVPKTANWLKLLAYYKAWFSSFRPKRDISFNSTACYNLIKLMENPESVIEEEQLLYNWKAGQSGIPGETYTPQEIVRTFLDDIGLYCTYYLPMDYFSMATDKPNENFQGNMSDIELPYQSADNYNTSETDIVQTSNAGTAPTVLARSYPYQGYTNQPFNAAIIKLAQRVLKYVNKNTIAGRSAADFIKAHFGVSLDSSHDLDKVYEIGRSSTNIQISELMNSAATEQMELGEFAGRGTGGSKSETFYFENGDMNGVWLTLSTIIPHSGFYQGILKENEALTKFDFFTPEFDAVGYQVLSRSEVSSDYPVSNNFFNPADVSNGVKLDNAFGFVPRYSHLKVSRNIVNGDFSLRGYRNSMAGYTLDRIFPYDFIANARMNNDPIKVVVGPQYRVTTVNDGFRRVDPTDHLGNYNRIFYYGRNDFDHFLINCVFDVTAMMPCISLSDSFDTITDEDGKEIEMTHS